MSVSSRHLLAVADDLTGTGLSGWLTIAAVLSAGARVTAASEGT